METLISIVKLVSLKGTCSSNEVWHVVKTLGPEGFGPILRY